MDVYRLSACWFSTATSIFDCYLKTYLVGPLGAKLTTDAPEQVSSNALALPGRVHGEPVRTDHERTQVRHDFR
jgi:hypothetical protein